MILGAVAIAGTASGIAINQAVQRLDAPKRPTNTAASRALPLSADPTHALSRAESTVYQQNSAPGGGGSSSGQARTIEDGIERR